MTRSVLFSLVGLAAALLCAEACTERHRLGGRYDDDAGGEAGALPNPPPVTAGTSGSTGGSGNAGQSQAGGTGGMGQGAGAAGLSGATAQPDPSILP